MLNDGRVAKSRILTIWCSSFLFVEQGDLDSGQMRYSVARTGCHVVGLRCGIVLAVWARARTVGSARGSDGPWNEAVDCEVALCCQLDGRGESRRVVQG